MHPWPFITVAAQILPKSLGIVRQLSDYKYPTGPTLPASTTTLPPAALHGLPRLRDCGVIRPRLAMRIITTLGLLVVVLSSTLARAQELAREIRRSPDGRHFVGWFDHDAGAPFGMTRSVVFRSTSDSGADIFSFVGTSRFTDAAWNPASTRCVITNEVNWEKTFVWLVYEDKSDKWLSRKLDVLAPMEAAYRRAIGDKDLPGFRLHLDKIEWLSDTQARFLVWSNLNDPKLVSSGRYLVTIDTKVPEAAPTMIKIPNE
jgi:hypothetical protein